MSSVMSSHICSGVIQSNVYEAGLGQQVLHMDLLPRSASCLEYLAVLIGDYPGLAGEIRAVGWELSLQLFLNFRNMFQQYCVCYWEVMPESRFLAATKQLYEQYFLSVCLSVCPSVCLSVTPFWLCSHHRIITKFSGVITNDRSDVHTKGQGQRSRSQRSQPNLTVSGL